MLIVGTFTATIVGGSSPVLGLDLQGGIEVRLEPVKSRGSSVLDKAVDIIRSRVNGLGVAETEVKRDGDQIVVDLPGVKDRTRPAVGGQDRGAALPPGARRPAAPTVVTELHHVVDERALGARGRNDVVHECRRDGRPGKSVRPQGGPSTTSSTAPDLDHHPRRDTEHAPCPTRDPTQHAGRGGQAGRDRRAAGSRRAGPAVPARPDGAHRARR